MFQIVLLARALFKEAEMIINNVMVWNQDNPGKTFFLCMLRLIHFMPSGPHQQFCAQGFLSCFSCLCIACVQTSPISFVAGNCLYSLRNKRYRVVSEQRKTEERRGTRFSVCPIFHVVFDSRSLSVPCSLLRS